MTVLRDFLGRRLRLTPEREAHILQRPEMARPATQPHFESEHERHGPRGQLGRVEETLLEPDAVKQSRHDPAVHLYYRRYARTPVTQKFLLVAAKVSDGEGFVITAFFTDRVKKGEVIWPKK